MEIEPQTLKIPTKVVRYITCKIFCAESNIPIFYHNSSAVTSSLHSPLSISTTSNGSGSSYINSGSSDEETDDENGETSAVDSGQVCIVSLN